MPRYTIKMNVVMMGLETIIIDDPADYQVGQTISISPKVPMTVQDQNGNGVTISPGVSMAGTVIDKRY
jgi:hypothetical protein